jgi:hypothetical protein
MGIDVSCKDPFDLDSVILTDVLSSDDSDASTNND